MLVKLNRNDCDFVVALLKKQETNPQTLKFLHEINDIGLSVFEQRLWFSGRTVGEGGNQFVLINTTVGPDSDT